MGPYSRQISTELAYALRAGKGQPANVDSQPEAKHMEPGYVFVHTDHATGTDYAQIGHQCQGPKWWHAQSKDLTDAELAALVRRLGEHMESHPAFLGPDMCVHLADLVRLISGDVDRFRINESRDC